MLSGPKLIAAPRLVYSPNLCLTAPCTTRMRQLYLLLSIYVYHTTLLYLIHLGVTAALNVLERNSYVSSVLSCRNFVLNMDSDLTCYRWFKMQLTTHFRHNVVVCVLLRP